MARLPGLRRPAPARVATLVVSLTFGLLWGTVPTALGAAPVPYLVKDILPSGSATPTWLTAAAGSLYFVARDAGRGREL